VNEQLEPVEPEFKTVMEIKISKDGRCQVTGPVHDKVASYGILEIARDAISDFHKQQKGPQIHKPEHRIMDFLRSGKK